MKFPIACTLPLFCSTFAQQTIYGQCAGIGYAGPTNCPDWWSCQYQNPWYSQCLPGSAPTNTSTQLNTTYAVPATLQTTTTSALATSTSLPSNSASISTSSGTSFVIDGKEQYFAGTNAYWIGFLNDNDNVDTVMSHLQSSGLKVLRVWGFNDVNAVPSPGTIWYQSLVEGCTPVINTGADGLERLDYVVASAAAHNVKLIITFVNNWSAYGGIPAYLNYFGGSHEQWFNNTAAQAQYKAYIQAVVSRYSSRSAIFAWELANEIRCSGCDTSVITNWAMVVSAYIKSLDSNHMVTLGDEGWAPSAGDGSYPYTLAEGVSFVDNLRISTLDFGTFHMYPETWGETDSTTFPTEWIQSHGAACVAAAKPCLLEEYGLSDHAGEIPWQKTALGTNGIAAGMFWQDGDSLNGCQTADDGFTIYYGSSDWEDLVTNHVAAIAASRR